MQQRRERTPLILQILKLPYWLTKFLLYLFGVISCSPIYFYCYLADSFIFNQNFDNNKTYYTTFWLPRVLAAIGPFAVAGGESLIIYWVINNFIEFDSKALMIITLISILIFMIISSVFGYKYLQKQFNIPKLRNVSEYLVLILYGVQDIFSAILTIIVVCLVFRAKELPQYKFEPHKRQYFQFVTRKLIESIIDLVCLPFWVILACTLWRFFHTRRIIKTFPSQMKRRFYVIYQGFNVVFDFIFIPFLLISLLNPFLKGRRLLSHMKILSVVVWRRLIIDEFFCTLLDIIPFGCFIVSMATIYDAGFALSLYNKTIEKTKPFKNVADAERQEDQAQVDNPDDSLQQTNLYKKVSAHNKQFEGKLRALYIMLIPLIIVDLMVIISHILVTISIYRYFIHNMKVETKKIIRGNDNKYDEPLTYSEYRSYLYRRYSMDENLDKNASAFSSYPKTIISEMLAIFCDLPCVIFLPILIIAIWRGKYVIKACQEALTNLGKPEKVNQDPFLRSKIIGEALLGIVDYICIMFSLATLVAPWRAKMIFKDLAIILNSEAGSVGAKPIMFICEAINAVLDLLFIPPYLVSLLNPFLKGRRLNAHMAKLPVSKWRSLIMTEFLNTLMDIIPFLCIIVSLFTIYDTCLAATLYKSIVTTTKPFSAQEVVNSDNEQPALEDAKKPDEDHSKLDNQISSHNASRDIGYRSLCLSLLLLIVIDLFVIVTNVVLLATIYRYLILQAKVKTTRLAYHQKGEQKPDYEALSYSEYRSYLYGIYSFQNNVEPNAPVFSTYPSMVILEFFRIILDLPIILISVGLLLVPWRGMNVLKAAKVELEYLSKVEGLSHESSLRSYIIIQLMVGLIDYFCFAAYLISLPIVWRFRFMTRYLKEILNKDLIEVVYDQIVFLFQATNALLDILFIPLFLGAFLNPFLKGRRLVRYMTKLTVLTWRKLILSEFINTLADIIPFICFVISLISIYETQLASILYKNILKKTEPLVFTDNEEALLHVDDLTENQTSLYNKVSSHSDKSDSKYRVLCLSLIPLIFVDLLVIIAKFMLLVTIYRNLILLRKVKTTRRSFEQKDQVKPAHEALSYSEYRNYLHDVFSMKGNVQADAPRFSTYPNMIFSEFLNLVCDLPALMICPIFIVFPWRGMRVKKAADEEWEKLGKVETYQQASSLRCSTFSEVVVGFIDYISIIFFLVSLVAPWRATYMLKDLKTILQTELKATGFTVIEYIFKALNAVLDLVFIPPFLIALLNPFVKGRRLVYYMSKFSVLMWRKIVLTEFCNTLADTIPFLCIVISIASVYEIIPAAKLYETIYQKTKPHLFNEKPVVHEENQQLLLQVAEENAAPEPQNPLDLYKKLSSNNAVLEDKYRLRSLWLIALIFVDILVVLANIVLKLTVYRQNILNRKIKTRKLAIENMGRQRENYEIFGYFEYRDYITWLFTLGEKANQNAPTFSTYPKMVITEMFLVFWDCPFFLICVLFIIFPWRGRHILRLARTEWENLDKIETLENESALRWYIITELFRGMLDYICFVIFVICLVAPWRYKYMNSVLRLILKYNFSSFEKQRPRGFENRMDAFDYFVFHILGVILIDLLHSPIILLLVPFYLVCSTWRVKLLFKCLDVLKLNEFSKHRHVVIQIGLICFVDFLCLIPLTLTLITVWRLETLRRMIAPPAQKIVIEEASSNLLQAPLINKDEEEQENKNKNIDSDDIPEHSSEENQLFAKQEINIELKSDRNIDIENQELLIYAPPAIAVAAASNESAIFDSKEITYSQIIENEKYIPLLHAGYECAWLVLLDIISLPFILFTYVNWGLIKKFKKTNQHLENMRKSSSGVAEHCKIETEAVYSKIMIGMQSIGHLILKVVLVIFLSVLLWRSPTFFILLKKPNLLEILELPRRENVYHQQQDQKKSFTSRLCSAVWFCVGEFVTDLIYLPPFLVLIIAAPWRSIPVFKQSYKYNEETSIGEQISEQRSLVMTQLWLGLRDILALFETVVIVLTLFRLPFFFTIIAKNRFPNSELSKEWFRKGLPNQNDIIDPKTRLSLEKCVNLSFKELLKDIFFVPFGVLLLIIAPWRIFTLYHIFISQVERIPTRKVEVRKMKLASRRTEVVSTICTVFISDYLNILKIALIIATIYRVPMLLKVIFKYMFNSGRYQRGEFSFSSEVHTEYKKARVVPLVILFSLIILLGIFRVKRTLSRLSRYYKGVKESKKIALPKQEQPRPITKNSLSGLEWNVYSQICQYLTVQDLARLTQVNKRLYALNQNDAYWQYLADRDWNSQKSWNNNANYKEKCIRAVIEGQVRQKNQVMSQEQLDALYGVLYIVFEETVKSLRWVPQFFLIPAKLIGSLFWCVFGKDTEFSHFVPKRSAHMIDVIRIFLSRKNLKEIIPNYEASNSFKKIHFGLVSWTLLVVVKYVCEIGYILGYIGCFFVRITSAGEVSPVEVTTIPETGETKAAFSKKKQELVGVDNRFGAFVLYVFQLAFICLNGLFLGALAAAPAYFLYSRVGWVLNEAIFGPCLILLIHYAAVLNIILTEGWYIAGAAPFFRPYKALTEPLVFLWFITKTVTKFTGTVIKTVCKYIYKGLVIVGITLKKLAKVLAEVILFLWKSLVQGMTWLCVGLKTVIVAISKNIWKLGKKIGGGYTGILVGATKCTLQCGSCGELLLIPIALLWMFWPLFIPFLLKNYIYLIPCGLVSIIFFMVGYKKIKEAYQQN